MPQEITLQNDTKHEKIYTLFLPNDLDKNLLFEICKELVVAIP